MAPSRDPIKVIVPFIDGNDANRKNGKPSASDEKIERWGRDGGKLEVVMVSLETSGPCYRSGEEMSIVRSLSDALGPHPTFFFVRLDWSGELRNLPNTTLNREDCQQIREHYEPTAKHVGSSKGNGWWAYLADTHNFLIRLQDCQQPNGLKMMAILHSQAQGLGGLFYVASQPLVIHPDKKVALSSEPEARRWNLPYIPFNLCKKDPAAMRLEVGRGTGDWTDKAPHLYVLDPHTTGRSKRTDYVIQAMRGLSGDRIITILHNVKIPSDPSNPLYEINDEKRLYLFGGNSDLRFRDWCISIKHNTREADVRSNLTAFGGFNPIRPAFNIGQRFSAGCIDRIQLKKYDVHGNHLNPLRRAP
ncbi:hypothetical protein J3E69DRAFT_381730 [Trichoderma sp. SZMC 28015]